MQIKFAAATDIGQVREANEDSYCVLDKLNSIYICDGMGGHVAGATASQLAIETIMRFNTLFHPASDIDIKKKNPQLVERLDRLNGFLKHPYPEIGKNMVNGIQLANHQIFATAEANPQFLGMGTTVVGIGFDNNLCHVAHVGDSRAYLIRNNSIEQLTEDHSWLNELLQSGKIKPEEADKFPHRNVITRALGVNESVQIDFRSVPAQVGDIYLLSSDGLHDLIQDVEIGAIVTANPDNLEKIVDDLIREANLRGGKDNISVIVAQIVQNDSETEVSEFRDSIDEETREMKQLEAEILNLMVDTDLDETKTITLSSIS